MTELIVLNSEIVDPILERPGPAALFAMQIGFN